MKEKVYDSVSKDMVGKEITLLGLAADVKAGACLKLQNDIIVYIQGLDCWNSEFIGKNFCHWNTTEEKIYS